jgi:hypothetical protein
VRFEFDWRLVFSLVPHLVHSSTPAPLFRVGNDSLSRLISPSIGRDTSPNCARGRKAPKEAPQRRITCRIVLAEVILIHSISIQCSLSGKVPLSDLVILVLCYNARPRWGSVYPHPGLPQSAPWLNYVFRLVFTLARESDGLRMNCSAGYLTYCFHLFTQATQTPTPGPMASAVPPPQPARWLCGHPR